MTRTAMMTALMGVLMLTASRPEALQTSGSKLRVTAFAVNMSNIGTGGTADVEFLIDRWSTEKERSELIATMLDRGQDALLQAFQKMPSHGRLRFPSWQGPDPLNVRLGWDIKYAAQRPEAEGGQRIVLAMDRYMSFWEARNRPRTVDYPFTLIELRVNKDGEGEGKLSVATKITFDKAKNVIELETYASEPVRLQNVRVRSRT